MKSKFVLLASVLFVGQAIAQTDLSVKYPGPWQTDYDSRISRTLTVNSISGCGEYKFKEDAKKSKSYVVYCSRDGKNWLAYIVWAASEKVMGPYPPDPSLD